MRRRDNYLSPYNNRFILDLQAARERREREANPPNPQPPSRPCPCPLCQTPADINEGRAPLSPPKTESEVGPVYRYTEGGPE